MESVRDTVGGRPRFKGGRKREKSPAGQRMEAKAHRANRHVKDLSRIRCLREVGVFIIQSKEDVMSSQLYLLESAGVDKR